MLTLIAIILAVSALVGIAYQDFRERLVSIWLFAVLLVSMITITVIEIGYKETFNNWMVNTTLLSVQLGAVFGYFYFKTKETKFFDKYFGLGDLVFLVIIAVPFSAINFMLFYSVSLLITLAGYGLYRITKGATTVPLAGALSVCMLVAMVVGVATSWSPWHDTNLISLSYE